MAKYKTKRSVKLTKNQSGGSFTEEHFNTDIVLDTMEYKKDVKHQFSIKRNELKNSQLSSTGTLFEEDMDIPAKIASCKGCHSCSCIYDEAWAIFAINANIEKLPEDNVAVKEKPSKLQARKLDSKKKPIKTMELKLNHENVTIEVPALLEKAARVPSARKKSRSASLTELQYINFNRLNIEQSLLNLPQIVSNQGQTITNPMSRRHITDSWSKSKLPPTPRRRFDLKYWAGIEFPYSLIKVVTDINQPVMNDRILEQIERNISLANLKVEDFREYEPEFVSLVEESCLRLFNWEECNFFDQYWDDSYGSY